MEKKLWYKNPGTTFSEALPFGNGSLGGMFYGEIPQGHITLNLDTVWSGTGTKEEKEVPIAQLSEARDLIFSRKYQEAEQLIKEKMLGFFNESYLPMADFSYRFLDIQEEIKSYRRELNLENGMLGMEFEAENCRIRNQIFSSYPDKMIVLQYESLKGSSMNIDFQLKSLLKHKVIEERESLHLEGTAPSHVEPNYVECPESVFYHADDEGMYFSTNLVVHSTDGKIEVSERTLKIRNASKIVLLITAADGYQGYKQPLCRQRSAIYDKCVKQAAKGTAFSYKELEVHHQEDYRKLYDRVNFELGDGEISGLATDERIEQIKQDAVDLDFYTLFFQYGRYLMISSSRVGSQPTNLQGIWNEEIRPAWSSNYTININTQMNYWMVCAANLAECQEPLNRMLEELSDRGMETATRQYHCRGWAANHNVDLWRQTNPVSGLPKYAYWPMGGVWLASHLYIYYRYTLDKAFLEKTAYPVLKGCVEFCLDYLVEGADGVWHTCPSTTPENVFADDSGNICSVSYSTTLDMTLIKELFINYIEISKEIETEEILLKRITEILPKLPEFQIGPDGCLQEWAEPFAEVEVGHRHLSPVYGIHPGNILNKYDNPKLLEAGRKFIEKRINHGGGHIGWSCAWLISLQARLEDAEKAYSYLRRMVQHSIYNNMLDLHPPLGENFEGEKEVFQIDGNFGAVEGILTMLVQSHLDKIHLLPALPSEWEQGVIQGIRASGGFEICIKWKQGKLESAVVKSICGSRLSVCYDKTFRIIDKTGATLAYSDENGLAVCSTEKGGEYIIMPYFI